jgi:hypothetical protein
VPSIRPRDEGNLDVAHGCPPCSCHVLNFTHISGVHRGSPLAGGGMCPLNTDSQIASAWRNTRHELLLSNMSDHFSASIAPSSKAIGRSLGRLEGEIAIHRCENGTSNRASCRACAATAPIDGGTGCAAEGASQRTLQHSPTGARRRRESLTPRAECDPTNLTVLPGRHDTNECSRVTRRA